MAICRLVLAFALSCLLLCSLAPQLASTNVDAFRSPGITSAGGRHLQQIQTQCPIQFGLFNNYSIITDACPPVGNITVAPNYPKKQCCTDGLATFLCPYSDLINDPTSLCAGSFWSVMTLVTNHTQEFFMFICTDVNSPKGIRCPNVSNRSASTPSRNHALAVNSGSNLFLTLLVVVAIVEVLVLCF